MQKMTCTICTQISKDMERLVLITLALNNKIDTRGTRNGGGTKIFYIKEEDYYAAVNQQHEKTRKILAIINEETLENV